MPKLPRSVAERIRKIVTSPIPIWMQMRMDELQRGHYVVPPGSVPWLPIADWHESDCVSIDDGEVRIIAIMAKQPGTGAFRRLVEGILDCGLVPVVVAPLDDMEAILTAWGWQHTTIGSDFETYEDQWRPPEGWK